MPSSPFLPFPWGGPRPAGVQQKTAPAKPPAPRLPSTLPRKLSAEGAAARRKPCVLSLHPTAQTTPPQHLFRTFFYSMNAALTQTVRPHACTAWDAACSWSTGSASAASRGRRELKLCAQVSAGRDEAHWEEAKDRKKGVSWICRCENGC